MNQIAKLLPLPNILLDLEASSKKRVFEQAGILFENQHGIARSTVYDALFTREKLGSTGLGQGIAILLVPETATERHLQILSELAQMFADRGFREQLASAPDPAAVHSQFMNWQIDAPVDRHPAV